MSKRSNSSSYTIVVGTTERFLEWQTKFSVGVITGCSDKVRQTLRSCLGSIGIAMERYGLTDVRQIEEGHILRFFAELRNRGLSDRRITTYARAIRLLCRIMEREQMVPDNKSLTKGVKP